MIRTLKIILRVAIPAMLVIASTFAMTAFYYLHGSYPSRQGRLIVTGLQARVEIDRTARGVPTLTAHHAEDLSFALGFVHAQDRFFAMDLARRYAGGTLDELLGHRAADRATPAARGRDEESLRQRLLALSAEERQLISAYTRGVNTALQEMAHAPTEYLYLRRRPRSWSEADSLRVLDHYERPQYRGEITRREDGSVSYTRTEAPGLVSPAYPVRLLLTDQTRQVTGVSTPGAPVMRHGWTEENRWLHLPVEAASALPGADTGQRFITAAETTPLAAPNAPVQRSTADGTPGYRHPLAADGFPAEVLFETLTPEAPSRHEISLGPDGNHLTLYHPVSRHPLRPWETALPVRLANRHTDDDSDRINFQLDLLPQRLPLSTEELPGS